MDRQSRANLKNAPLHHQTDNVIVISCLVIYSDSFFSTKEYLLRQYISVNDHCCQWGDRKVDTEMFLSTDIMSTNYSHMISTITS